MRLRAVLLLMLVMLGRCTRLINAATFHATATGAGAFTGADLANAFRPSDITLANCPAGSIIEWYDDHGTIAWPNMTGAAAEIKGTSGNWTTMQAHAGETPVFVGTGTAAMRYYCAAQTHAYIVWRGIIFEGLDRTTAGVWLYRAGSMRFEDCIMRAGRVYPEWVTGTVSASPAFVVGEAVTQAGSGATGTVACVNGTGAGKRLYVYRTAGGASFDGTNNVTATVSGATVTAVSAVEVAAYSGVRYLTNTYGAIAQQSPTNITFSGCTFEHAWMTLNTGTTATSVLVEDCTIQDFSYDGVNTASCNGLVFNRNTWQNADGRQGGYLVTGTRTGTFTVGEEVIQTTTGAVGLVEANYGAVGVTVWCLTTTPFEDLYTVTGTTSGATVTGVSPYPNVDGAHVDCLQGLAVGDTIDYVISSNTVKGDTLISSDVTGANSAFYLTQYNGDTTHPVLIYNNLVYSGPTYCIGYDTQISGGAYEMYNNTFVDKGLLALHAGVDLSNAGHYSRAGCAVTGGSGSNVIITPLTAFAAAYEVGAHVYINFSGAYTDGFYTVVSATTAAMTITYAPAGAPDGQTAAFVHNTYVDHLNNNALGEFNIRADVTNEECDVLQHDHNHYRFTDDFVMGGNELNNVDFTAGYYVDYTLNNYVPIAASPLINAANAAYAPALDILGAARTIPDIGAYEYGGGTGKRYWIIRP